MCVVRAGSRGAGSAQHERAPDSDCRAAWGFAHLPDVEEGMRYEGIPIGATALTDEERAELSRKVKEANKRSEEGRGGGQR